MTMAPWTLPHGQYGQIGGTMAPWTMAPWNLPHGQYGQIKLTMATKTLEFSFWSMVKMDFLGSISESNFTLTTRNLDSHIGHGQNLDYFTSDFVHG